MERNEIIYEVLIPSLYKLYELDYFNIRIGVSERNICARLAYHMENLMHKNEHFKDFFADVEYNRKNDGTGKYYDNYQKVRSSMVSDLIVHKRDFNPNLLAVEMKRWENYDKRKADKDRLESIVSSPKQENRDKQCVYDTTLGAFIIYSPDRVKINFYEAKGTQGKMIGEMEFAYNENGHRNSMLDKIRESWRN